MPKKGGKKSHKSKAKGAGAGAGGAKVPDVKNIVSPAHKEEDKLLYGEGDVTTTTEAALATASGSAAAAPTVATEAPTSEPLTATAAPEKEKEEKELPAQEKEQISDVTKEQRGDAGTQALAAAAPTGSKKQAKKQKKEAAAKAAEPERPSTATTDKADLLTDTSKKTEPVAGPETTNGITTEVSDTAKKEEMPSEALATTATAAGAAGTAEYAGQDSAQQEQAQPAAAEPEKTDTSEAKPTTESVDDAEHRAFVQEEDTPVVTATPLVAPHVKRSHEVPVFATQERDQPAKKARVDESTEATVSQSNLAIPGRFPSPSVAGSTASGTDSAIAPETGDAAKRDTAADKPAETGTVVSQPSDTAQTTTPAAVVVPTEAAVSAPAAKEPAASKDTGRAEDKTTATSADTPAPATGPTPTSIEPAAVLPPTGQKDDASARPVKPSAVDTGAKAEQQAPQQQAPDKAVSKPAQQEPAPKKGGFMAWIKRKFKGDKKASAGGR